MDDDAYLEKILSTNPHKQEAGAWLEQKDGKERAVGDGEQDAAASSRLVRDLYRRGAVDVTAVDIEADAHLETTSTLIVTLPQEPEARRRVFQVEAKVARQAALPVLAPPLPAPIRAGGVFGTAE